MDGFVGGFQGLVAAPGTIAFLLVVGLVLLVARPAGVPVLGAGAV